MRQFSLVVLTAGIGLLQPAAGAMAQDRFEGLPGHDRYERVSKTLGQFARSQRVSGIEWAEDGTELTFSRGDTPFRVDLATFELIELEPEEEEDADRGGAQRRRRIGRGRQQDREASPDGAWIAVCEDWNVVLVAADAEDDADADDTADEAEEAERIKVTTDGHRKLRYGTASWVYGEELRQRTAMWWSGDSRRLVFYEFDERDVPDHYLTGDMTELHTSVLVEGYPKPGEPNPRASLLVYDLDSAQTTRIDTDNGEEHYVFNVRFAPDNSQLLLSRTNRHQNVLEILAVDLATGDARVVLTESQETWQLNRPLMRFLEDGHRFIWETERSGWKHYELRDLSGSQLNTISRGAYPVESVVEVDETGGFVYYMAFSDANPHSAQLHRAKLDGSHDVSLTSGPLHHSSVRFSPDRKWFIARSEAVDTPPTTRLYGADGTPRVLLAGEDTGVLDECGLYPAELFSFKADDGMTDIYGVLYRPTTFDPSRSYPLLIDVYGGPLSRGISNRYRGSMPICELGFLVAKIGNRGTTGRGKAFETAVYLRLGDIDLKDQVDGVRHLTGRPYVDAGRVGIYGHSYGGYMSALGILKYPDVFHAAVAGSAVTDFRNYDTIYTERFMRTPDENIEGYEKGSCMTYADQLTGKLLLVHGMVDDNVHPTNVWQLAAALYKAKKPFDMKLFPSNGHGIGPPYSQLRWEYFYDHLIANPVMHAAPTAPAATPAVHSP